MSEQPAAAAAVADVVKEPSPGANGLKRRYSDTVGQEAQEDSKKSRISSGKNSPSAAEDQRIVKAEPEETVESIPKEEDVRRSRRTSNVPDEKQRSKRLFGALLGNLNQSSDRTSKRRAEIEQRRKAELKQQDDERLEDRQRRLERLAVQRRNKQIDVDEQNMHTRHAQMLNEANFLQTKAEPKLYFRPWDLLPDEEDRIDDQLRETQNRIDDELAEFKETKRAMLLAFETSTQEERHKADVSTSREGGGAGATSEDVDQKDSMSGLVDEHAQAKSNDTNNTAKPAEVPDLQEAASDNVGDESRDPTMNDEFNEEHTKDEAEDDEEHMVEGDEDTVIY